MLASVHFLLASSKHPHIRELLNEMRVYSLAIHWLCVRRQSGGADCWLYTMAQISTNAIFFSAFTSAPRFLSVSHQMCIWMHCMPHNWISRAHIIHFFSFTQSLYVWSMCHCSAKRILNLFFLFKILFGWVARERCIVCSGMTCKIYFVDVKLFNACALHDKFQGVRLCDRATTKL